MKFSKIIITTSVGFAILIIMAAIGVFSLKNVVSVQLHPQKS